ncbi:ABC transporter ATP-binding protein [Chrysiogenes arsenatis]|uniref:ABC transporter ATP-binding protein n=1 Tax=Chrysiogenes arsenatis TaxID=309797 RepID=UPI0004253770|nr:ABC transporter ATP-binding protein [Chrysiogenes arsenatis]
MSSQPEHSTEQSPIYPLCSTALTKKYHAFTALHPLDLTLNSGEIFGLLGPNGAGKTTFISMISGLIAPDSGSITIGGYNLTENPIEARMQVGVVPQEIVSHGFFTVNQVLNFHSGYYGLLRNQERIDYLLHKLALFEHRKKLVRQLSGGMKRRLLIAKALVHFPPLLLLDEPTAGVDVELRNDLWEFVEELNRELKTTILLTTHYLEEAEKLCQRIGVLHHGRLIALNDTAALIHQLTLRRVTLTLANIPPHLTTVAGISCNGHTVKINIKHDETIGQLLSRLAIPLDSLHDIVVDEGRLEEAFKTLIQQHGTTGVPQ